jgi:outer membrane protein assembly factor BamB
MTFQSTKFRELEQRRKEGVDWDTALAEVFGYSQLQDSLEHKPKKKAFRGSMPIFFPEVNGENVEDDSINSPEKKNSLEKRIKKEIWHGSSTKDTHYPGGDVDAEHLELLWWFGAEGEICGEPLLGGTVEYLSIENLKTNKNIIYAFDTVKKEILWKYKVKARMCNQLTFSNGKIYFGADDEKVYALDACTGEKRWDFKTGGRIRTSCCIDDKVLYVGPNDQQLYALDTDAGQEIWHFNTKDYITQDPFVSKELVHIISGNRLRGIDKNARLPGDRVNEIWSFKFKGDGAKAFITDDNIYLIVKEKGLFVLEPSTGNVKWKFMNRHIDEDYFLLDDAIAYLCSSGKEKSDKIYALQADSEGKRIWSYKLPERIDFIIQQERIGSLPASSEGVLYFGASDRKVYAIDFLHKKKLWCAGFEQQEKNSMEAWYADYNTQPCIVHNTLVVADDKTKAIHGLSRKTGKEVWKYDMDETCRRIHLIDDVLYIHSYHKIVAFKVNK